MGEMKSAFAYRRVSGKGQLAGDGFERQRLAIEKYAAANGFDHLQWFDERAVCGATEWEDRPAWSEMMLSLNGCRTIIIERLDRLARDLFIQEHILRELKSRGIELLSTSEDDIDSSDDPTRILFRQILGAVAQFDRSITVLKLRGARERQRNRGERCEGQKPFGSRPSELEAISRMRRLRQSGSLPVDIANELNQFGVPTRHGKRWHANSVARILSRDKTV